MHCYYRVSWYKHNY